jgi:predicted RNA-binding Zn-ribbon protein involved in translation (DUF1610 family)
MQDWSIVKVASTIATIIGAITATVGAIKWVQTQSLTDAVDFVVT